MLLSKPIELTEIILDDPDDKIYHSGDTVTGRLIVASNAMEDIQVSELSVRMIGKAQTAWNAVPMAHVGYKKYFDYSQLLHRQDGGKTVINSGAIMEFPFLITLADSPGPCSYMGQFGFVKYSIRGILIPRSTEAQNYEEVEASYVDKDINFMADCDVSTFPGTKDPIDISWASDRRAGIFGCCRKNPNLFNFRLEAPKSGYTVGEQINYRFQFHNRSAAKVPDLVVNFVQQTTFIADDSSEKESAAKIIAAKKVAAAPPGKHLTRDLSFTIPEDSLPTKLGGCTIIHYEYFLEVRLDLENTNLVTIKCPILIGTMTSAQSLLEIGCK